MDDRTQAALAIFSGAFAKDYENYISILGDNPANEEAVEELRRLFKGCYEAADLFLQEQDMFWREPPLNRVNYGGHHWCPKCRSHVENGKDCGCAERKRAQNAALY